LGGPPDRRVDIPWDRQSSSRFSHPDSPCAVLYLGESKETCFWEAFGEELLDTMAGQKRGIAEESLEIRHFVEFTPPSNLRVLDTRDGRALQALGADHTTFKMPYAIAQTWARALMEHPGQPDGLLYESRLAPDGPRQCLALFDRLRLKRPGAIHAKDLGPMSEDVELLALLLREEIVVL
jgi:hypothetical protein